MCEYSACYMIFSISFDISTKVVFQNVEIENIINLHVIVRNFHNVSNKPGYN